MYDVVVTHAFRTPIGRYLGALKELSAADLGVAVTRGLLDRSGIPPDRVDEVLFGCGRQAGSGPNVARQISVRSGIPCSTPACTINKACASSLKALVMATQAIALGDAAIVIAGGTESMSRLPFFVEGMRTGLRSGHHPLVDAMYRDGFLCPMCGLVMGETAENLADRYAISREEQDRHAAESARRCERAIDEGRFRDEIVPVAPPAGTGLGEVSTDEHPRRGVTVESLARLQPVFRPDGIVHPGAASGITDGAAALLVMAGDQARELGLDPLARVEAYATAGVDPAHMGIGPVPATRTLLQKLHLSLDDYDLIELNEAFAAQVIACDRELHLPMDRLNVNGGAIPLGHPIGATGARITTTLLHELRRRGGRRGLATLCVSGGMGMSVSFVRE